MTAIRPSRPQTRAARELVRLLGPGSLVLSGPADLLAYSYDATGTRTRPEVVVLPASTSDTAAAVRWAVARGMPVVPRGAATNLSGGTVPVSGGMVIHLSRLDRVVDIDAAARRAIVGPGLTNLALQERLAPLGLCFAPDPASQKVSTLGGNVAENAGGPHCLKYGVTADHVLGMTVVLAGGEVVRMGYGRAPDPGLAAVTAMVGSEGTLGVFTELVLRLEPLPPAVRTILAVFDRLEDAGRSVSEIIAQRMLPATLELMDRTTLRVVEESFHLGYPTDAEGALLIEIDGPEPGLPRQLAQIESICRGLGAREVSVARDEADRARLWSGRRAAFGALARRSPVYSVQDITVPRNRLVEMMRQVEAVFARHELETAIIAHAGDGNLHPIVLYREATAERLERVHRANHELMTIAVELGGTISGEHGVGTEKLPFLHLAVPPPSMSLMRRVKAGLDPDRRLNPGKAVPDGPGAEPVTAGILDPTSEKAGGGAGLTATGRGSRLSWAGLPGRGEAAAAPSGIIELDDTNLTVTALAGTPSAQLREALDGAGFWLPPLDHGYGGTIGGDLATAIIAPTSAPLGGMARWVLGAELVLGSGEVAPLGGRTMKNVAGYNLLHLLAGSYGRLGLIWSITLRVWPRPEADRTLGMPAAGWAQGPVDEASLRSLVRDTRPAAVVAVGGGWEPPGRGQDQPAFLVRLTGPAEDVAWSGEAWRGRLPLAWLDQDQASAGWARWSAPLRAAAAGAARPARLFEVHIHPAGIRGAAAELVGGGDMGGDGDGAVGGCGPWSACVVSGQGYLASGPLGPPPGLAERLGLRPAGPGHPGPLDDRIMRAFDPQGRFAGRARP